MAIQKDKFRNNLTPDERFKGAFFGFVTGDAYGYPCRNLSFDKIVERFEKKGCMELCVSRKDNKAHFTEATQLMLFTADGIIWGDTDGVSAKSKWKYADYVFNAYQYWYFTQTKKVSNPKYEYMFNTSSGGNSRLLKAKIFYKNMRSNDNILQVLTSIPFRGYGKIHAPIKINQKELFLKDAGGLKRIMPAGLFFCYDPEIAFRAAADFAAITHTANSAFLSAGVYSTVIAYIMNDYSIEDAIRGAYDILVKYENHKPVSEMIEKSLYYAFESEMLPQEVIENVIGTSSRAEENLGVALFSSLVHGNSSYIAAIQLAVNNDGPSDITGALTGGIVGCMHGENAIPKKWREKLAGTSLIEDVCLELYAASPVLAGGFLEDEKNDDNNDSQESNESNESNEENQAQENKDNVQNENLELDDYDD